MDDIGSMYKTILAGDLAFRHPQARIHVGLGSCKALTMVIGCTQSYVQSIQQFPAIKIINE